MRSRLLNKLQTGVCFTDELVSELIRWKTPESAVGDDLESAVQINACGDGEFELVEPTVEVQIDIGNCIPSEVRRDIKTNDGWICPVIFHWPLCDDGGLVMYRVRPAVPCGGVGVGLCSGRWTD